MFRSFDPEALCTQTTVTNGLNQLAAVNPGSSPGQASAATYDANGNMTTDPVTGKSYLYYESSNQLRNTPSPWTSLDYDAFDRLLYTEFPTTYYVFDGNDLIAQYDGSGVLQKRFAFAPGGEPLVAYDASGTRTFLESDERGSVIALANDSGSNLGINSYDEYGIPSATNQGTFQYAGMLWLSGPGLYAPTYRSFNANQGRFNQTDPIGMAGGVNLYNYTGNDPVNFMDLLGLDETVNKPPCVEKNGQNCKTLNGGALNGQTRPLQNGNNPTLFWDAAGEYGYDANGNQTYVFIDLNLGMVSLSPRGGTGGVAAIDRSDSGSSCTGLVGNFMSDLFTAGTVVEGGGAALDIFAFTLQAGDVTPAAPATILGGVGIGTLGTSGVIVGDTAQVVAGTYFAFHGNAVPIANAFANITFGALGGHGPSTALLSSGLQIGESEAEVGQQGRCTP